MQLPYHYHKLRRKTDQLCGCKRLEIGDVQRIESHSLPS